MTLEQQMQKENLEQIWKEKADIAYTCCTGMEQSYKLLVEQTLRTAGFNLEYVKGIYPSVNEFIDNKWQYDHIRVEISNNTDGKSYSVDVYINTDKVRLNNCCTGDWYSGSSYHKYLEAMVIIANSSEQILGLAQSIDRVPLQEAFNADCELRRLENKIAQEEHEARKKAKIEEIDSAEYIGLYRSLRGYEDGYIEGQDVKVLECVYKVIKRTPKFITFEEYEKTTNPDGSVTWAPNKWFRSEAKERRERMYNPSYVSLNKEQVNIVD